MALINRLCMEMRIMHYKLPLSPRSAVCVNVCVCVSSLSRSLMYVTFPYGPPGVSVKKYHLNTGILSFLMPPNYQHLSQGFFRGIYLFGSSCVGVNMCHCSELRLLCASAHVGVRVCERDFLSLAWLCSAGFSAGLLCRM